MNKLIINFTPTGMVPSKAMTPLVPISTDEIVEDVLDCAGVGVSIVHLHARVSQGLQTQDPEDYAEIIRGIRR